jgi:hypothetical protein
MAHKRKSTRKGAVRRMKGCSKKRPCKASARSPGYVLGLGKRRVKALAKSRGKKVSYAKYTQAELKKIGRARLKSIRKYNKKR